MISSLTRMKLLFSAIKLLSDCWRHATVEVSAIIMSWFRRYFSLRSAEGFCRYWKELQGFVLHFWLYLLQHERERALRKKRYSSQFSERWKDLGYWFVNERPALYLHERLIGWMENFQSPKRYKLQELELCMALHACLYCWDQYVTIWMSNGNFLEEFDLNFPQGLLSRKTECSFCEIRTV